MSPLVGIFAITLLSSILYNKFDSNSRATSTRRNSYHSSEKTNTGSFWKQSSQGQRHDSEFFNEIESDFSFENIGELDVCIFTVVAGNQKFCEEKNDENLDRLTLLLMACHGENEHRKFPKCLAGKMLSDCISSLSTADLEIFKTVKKRALTVCQEVSQQLFMINSQRRAQALLETAQLHSSVMTSFKDNQKLLENITSQTLSRLRAQRLAFMKDMKLFNKYFAKNESFFIEAAQAHLTLLSRHKEIIGGLEKDVNVLTEGFFQSLETMQQNFTAFSVRIFEKHSEIMANLNGVENTADKILRQLEMIEEFDSTVTLRNAMSWIMMQIWRNSEVIYFPIALFLIMYSLLLRSKLFTWIKFTLVVLTITGIVLRYKYTDFFIVAWLSSVITELFMWCFDFLTSNRTVTQTGGDGSSLQGQPSTTGDTRRRSNTLEDISGHISDNIRQSVGIQESTTGDMRSESSTSTDTLEHESGKGDSVSSSTSSVLEVTASTTGVKSGKTRTCRDIFGYDKGKNDTVGHHCTSRSEETGETSRERGIGSNSCDPSSNSFVATEREIGDHQAQTATRGDGMVLEGTRIDFMENGDKSPVTEQGGATLDNEVRNCKDMIPDGASIDLLEQRSSRTKQRGELMDNNEQNSTTGNDRETYSSPEGNIIVQRRIQSRSMGREFDFGFRKPLGNRSEQTSTICDSEIQVDPNREIKARTDRGGDREVQADEFSNKGVQTSTKGDSYAQTDKQCRIVLQTSTCIKSDNQVQTKSSNDMGEQTSTKGDSQVQAGPGINMEVQPSTRNDSYVQTGASDDNSGIGTTSDMEVHKSTTDDSQVEAVGDFGVQMRLLGDNQVRRRMSSTPKARTRGDSLVPYDTDTIVGVQTSTNIDDSVQAGMSRDTEGETNASVDNNVQAGTSNDARVQMSKDKELVVWTNSNTESRRQNGIAYDIGVPRETLGIPEETMGELRRQSGIIVNIGDAFTSSYSRRPSRASSPYEVHSETTGDVRQQSSTYEDSAGNRMDISAQLRRVSGQGEGTSRDFPTLQVGVQINRSGSSDRTRECGLPTLQGTPCRRRVSAARCNVHRHSRQ